MNHHEFGDILSRSQMQQNTPNQHCVICSIKHIHTQDWNKHYSLKWVLVGFRLLVAFDTNTSHFASCPLSLCHSNWFVVFFSYRLDEPVGWYTAQENQHAQSKQPNPTPNRHTHTQTHTYTRWPIFRPDTCSCNWLSISKRDSTLIWAQRSNGGEDFTGGM